MRRRTRCVDVLTILLAASLAVQLCWTTAAAADDDDDDEEERRARQLLDTFYPLLEKCWSASISAEWDYNVNITDENEQRLIEQSKLKAEFTQEVYKNMSQFNWHNFTDRNLSRQLSMLTDLGVAVLPIDQVLRADKLKSEMQWIYSAGKLCNRPSDIGTERADKCYALDPGVTRIMATSRDWDELKWAWEEWRTETGRKMKDNYSDFTEIHNRAARLNGYADNGVYWRAAFESDDFEEVVEKLWSQVRPLYEQLHAYVRRKLIDAYPGHRDGFPKSGHIPAHLTGNMWAQTWTPLLPLVIPFANQSSSNVTKELLEQGYNATRMFHLADEFFTSLGLEPVPPLFWEKSMLTKPDDGRLVVCHASAWDFLNGRDFRIKQCTDVTGEYLRTIHHEMGHVQYYLQYRHQPIVYRTGANPGFHEAVGDVISLSSNTPEHMRKIGFMKNFVDTREADLNFLMKQALEKVAFLPFGYLIDKWRWSIFENVTTKETYNTDWWKLRCALQGVSPPVARTSEDFDAGSKYHVPGNTPYIRYFVSFIIQFQFHKTLCRAANVTGPLHRCDIYKSREAGDLLRRMLQLGNSKPWPDAMEVLTGQRQMDAGPLLEYFQPLHDWLLEQNAGHNVTWDDRCPPGSFAESPGRNAGFRLAAADRCAMFVRALLCAVATLAGVLLRVRT